jgi:hypothetical protein
MLPGYTRIDAWASRHAGLNNAFVRAKIGEQEVTHISVDQFSLGFTGYTVAMPAADDTLTVWVDGQKIQSGIRGTRDGLE